MRLSEVLDALPRERRAERRADDDPVIRGLAYDSRKVSPGDLFVAVRGELADGHDYLKQALELGAAALLVEALPPDLDLGGRPAVVVDDSRRALAPLACAFFGAPSRELCLVGITGTNGKTSSSFLVESILARAGRHVGLIGTVEIRYADVRARTLNTTPESLDLQRTLRAMRTRAVDAVAMEVSSHGVAMGRIDGCRFAVAAFTNVTQDHLDFHGTMDAYLASKTTFFRNHLDGDGVAVVNADDDSAPAFEEAARAAGARLLRVSRRADARADVWLESADVRLDATHARLRLPGGPLDVRLPLVGDFNLENLLVAAGCAVALDVAPEHVAEGAESCPQVPGRVERVGGDRPDAPTVFVDYAHTPDALDKLLRTLRPLVRGHLVTLFGCGGDRDRAKRPLMARAAARWSDRVVATSDNPRTEDPRAILAEVEAGLTDLERVAPESLAQARGAYAVVVDRREAIDRAVGSSGAQDLVVLAGKGHEDYQIVGRERFPFDDRDEARRALDRWSAA